MWRVLCVRHSFTPFRADWSITEMKKAPDPLKGRADRPRRLARPGALMPLS
jgi:hypothetical protein